MFNKLQLGKNIYVKKSFLVFILLNRVFLFGELKQIILNNSMKDIKSFIFLVTEITFLLRQNFLLFCSLYLSALHSIFRILETSRNSHLSSFLTHQFVMLDIINFAKSDSAIFYLPDFTDLPQRYFLVDSTINYWKKIWNQIAAVIPD